MKKLAVLVMLAAIAPVVAATSMQETSTSFFCGIVLGVDASKGLLSIEEASLDADKMTFTVSADADVTKMRTSIELRDIRVGDPVSVEYRETAAGPIAVAVKVITKPEST